MGAMAAWEQNLADRLAPFLSSGPQNFDDTVTVADDKSLRLSATVTGIGRLIQLREEVESARPWISWLRVDPDTTERHVAAMGYHTRDGAAGSYHRAFEVKTSADPAGSTPADMRTRFSIPTEVDFGLIGLAHITFLELNQSYHRAATPFGLKLRGMYADGATAANFAQLLAQVDASDNVTAYLDVLGKATLGQALVFFRNTSSTSSSNPSFTIKKGDGSNTNCVHIVTAGNSTTVWPSMTLHDSVNVGFSIVPGTTNGLKIGTATTQKIGFYNATPVVQGAAVASPTADVAALKTAVDAIRSRLSTVGLIAP